MLGLGWSPAGSTVTVRLLETHAHDIVVPLCVRINLVVIDLGALDEFAVAAGLVLWVGTVKIGSFGAATAVCGGSCGGGADLNVGCGGFCKGLIRLRVPRKERGWEWTYRGS